MLRRKFRRDIPDFHGFQTKQVLYSFPDLAEQNSAYSISNILQSAQLNRELPPMKSYNFTEIDNKDLSKITPIMDDICAVGNLQNQLEQSINRYNEYVSLANQNSQPTEVEKPTDAVQN